MASRIRIELDKAGVGALLKSAEVKADVDRRARAIAAAAGDGMKASSWVGFDRARARVQTDSPEADRAEAEDRALTRAIDAGRG